jgi:prepilin-type N-terminal cleavage/methylation domain-containing protein
VTSIQTRQERGFTLVELIIVMALLLPILGVVLSSSDVALQSMRASEAAGDAVENVQRIAQRVTQFIRPAVLSTYRMEATDADVALGRAAAAGEWVDPVDLEPRTAMQFRSADGVLAINASALTPVRVLRFRLDPGETVDGTDEDGDRLVDEGSIVYETEGDEIVIGTGIEQCTFTLDARKITLRLRAAKRRGDGTIARATTIQALTFRNN